MTVKKTTPAVRTAKKAAPARKTVKKAAANPRRTRAAKPAPIDPFATPVVLVNAMRRERELYVEVDGTPAKLPRVPAPTVVARHSKGRDVTIAVPVDMENPDAGVTPTSINVVEAQTASMVLNDLPILPGVVYVVDPEILAQHPHRDDLVVPAAYGMWTSPKHRKALDKGQKKKARKLLMKELKAYPHEWRFPLVSVARGPLPTVTGETTSISTADLDD